MSRLTLAAVVCGCWARSAFARSNLSRGATDESLDARCRRVRMLGALGLRTLANHHTRRIDPDHARHQPPTQPKHTRTARIGERDERIRGAQINADDRIRHEGMSLGPTPGDAGRMRDSPATA